MVNRAVKFNVGGVRYEVSRSLLESFPDSMLARIASERWQEDPESEIFIDRDGRRFTFVLDYLRDGSVVLPVTESKASVLVEMKYFGIDADVSKVTETRTRDLHGLMRKLNKLQDYSKETQVVVDLVHFCVENCVSNRRSHDAKNFRYEACSSSEDMTNFELLKNIRNCSNESVIIERANDLLSSIGMKIREFGFARDARFCFQYIKGDFN